MTRETSTTPTEFDVPAYGSTLDQAFDWVVCEITFPNETAREALHQAFLTIATDGYDTAVRVLGRVWSEDARWPNAEAYLRTLGWHRRADFADDGQWTAYIDDYDGPEVLDLLYSRLSHVAHHLFRNAQVRSILDPRSPGYVRAYTHAVLNKEHDWYEWGDPCGVGIDKIISIEDALPMLAQPAHPHPACRCTIDPFPVSSQDRARLQQLVSH